MEVPLSASWFRWGASLPYPQGVLHGPRTASGRYRSYFWHCPLACCVTSYKSLISLHFPDGKTAAETFTTVSNVTATLLLQAWEQDRVVSLVRGIRQSVTHFFWYDWIALDKSTRGSEADGVIFHFIQLKKWKKFLKTYKTSTKHSGKVLGSFKN